MQMRSMNVLKGISPLVATVLLIAFVVSVGGLVAAWTTSFTKDTTQLVADQSKLQITCQYGKLNLKNLQFASTPVKLSGIIENNGLIALGNLTLTVIYQNASSQRIQLCSDPTGAASCSSGNLTLTQSQLAAFNITIGGSNYDSMKMSSNCTSAYDTADRGDVS
jgi:flagellin-like protein